VPEPARNYAKPFAIGGFIVAEIIMVLTMLAPNLDGATRPLDHLIIRLVVGFIFFGPFGLAVGTGVGLLFSGLVEHVRRWTRARRRVEDEGR
jgi:hypothetical protein